MPPERRGRGIGDARRSRPLSLSRRVVLAVPGVLIALAALAGGATSTALAPAFTLTVALVLAGHLFLDRRSGIAGLMIPSILFTVLLVYGVWTLTPLTIGEPPPIWHLIGASPSTTIDRSATVREIVKLLGLGCVFLVGTIQGRSRGEARFTTDALIVSGAVLLTLCMMLHAVGREATGFGGRMVGPMGSPNVIATAAGAYLILALARLVQRIAIRPSQGWRHAARQLQDNTPWLATVLLSGAGLILSASRGAIASVMTVIVLWIGWRLVRGRGSGRTVLGIGLLLAAVTGFAFLLAGASGPLPPGSDALVQGNDRIVAFGAYWRAFYGSPLFGYGLGSFDAVNRQILTSETYADLWQNNAAHNVILQWLMECGAVGAGLIFAVVGLVLIGGWRNARSAGPALASSVFILHGMTDFTLQVFAMAALFAFLLGLHAAPRAARS